MALIPAAACDNVKRNGTISLDVRRPTTPMQNSLGKFENITIGTKCCGNLSLAVVAGVSTDVEIANKFRKCGNSA